jgi:spermidine synthase
MFTGKEPEYSEYRHETSLEVVKNGFKGKIRFDGPVHIPMLTRENIYGETQVWMSLTPMEVMSQKSGLDFAQGRTLIGGLGLGWLTSKVLEKPEVSQVVQIELDPHVLEFFGRPLSYLYPDKLDLVEANVWEFLENTALEQFDTILLDIWPRYNDARRDQNLKELRKLHSRVWAWGQEKFINRNRP